MKDLTHTLGTLLVVVPVLALFLGVGAIGVAISQTWTDGNTQSLITGLATVCGGGVVVVGILLSLLVGVPLAIRAYGEGGKARRQWSEEPEPWSRPPLPVQDANWRALPPTIPGPNPWELGPGWTGGGQVDLLPGPEQDGRLGFAE